MIISVLVAGLLGTHVSMVAFAHYALGNTESWIWDLASGDGWQVGTVLARCTSTTLFANPSLPSTPDHLWCRQWWLMFHRWTGGPGGSFFGATMLLIVAAGAMAYVYALTRLVPKGPARRRTTAYATRDELRSFLRPRGTLPEAMADAGALPLGHTVPDESRPHRIDVWLPLPYRCQHVWILGVTGVGKTSGLIKRWLATDARLDGRHAPATMSTVAVDVKDPDLWDFAAPIAMQYDRRVIRWSPMSSGSTGHNFLDYVHTVGDALDTAETILSNDTEYNRKDPFWRQTELTMLATTIQLVCEETPERLLGTFLQDKMRNILGVVPPPRSLAFILGLSHLHPSEFMAYIEHVDAGRAVWRDRSSKVFQARDDKTVGAWQGLQNVLVIFRDPDVIAATSRSDFHLSVVARQPTTLIIGLPRKPGSRRRVLTALFLRQLLQELDDLVRERESQKLPVPVTFLLDELGVLGLIPTFQDFIATYRDMGVSFVIATQDRKQLIDVYGETKADTLIANLHTRIVFGRDLRPEQADEICQALGETIVPEPGVQYEHKSPLSIARRGTRIVYQVRRLLEPNELRAMPEFRAVVVLPGDVKATVGLSPVHTDPLYRGMTRPISSIEALRHDIRMDRVLGRLTATPRIRCPSTAPPHPDVLVPPKIPIEPPEPAIGTADLANDPLRLLDPAPLPRERSLVESAGETTVPPAKPRDLPPADPPPPTSVEKPPTSNLDSPAPPPGSSATFPPAVLRHPLASESPMEAFMEAVLRGALRDERLTPGSPRGWVCAEKRSEFLVPWGFLRDWGFKTKQRFTDLEATWTRDGLVRGRGSVVVNGRWVTCVLFTHAATLQLREDLRGLVAQSFVPVPGSEVRPSKTRVLMHGNPEPGKREGSTRITQSSSPLPHLHEFLRALDQTGGHFIGHPDRDKQLPVHGRWQARSKDGTVVLLVERHTADAMLKSIGVMETPRVLTLWKQAGILFLGGQVRGGFFTRRTHREGNEFLTLRWDQIRPFLSPQTPKF
ncbi:MAG TPA: type IV secretory system conjugative DNA transfer family protein [bacterium]|nr:type IV secretory system conjugative DNA transfer family protein [bacterium]